MADGTLDSAERRPESERHSEDLEAIVYETLVETANADFEALRESLRSLRKSGEQVQLTALRRVRISDFAGLLEAWGYQRFKDSPAQAGEYLLASARLEPDIPFRSENARKAFLQAARLAAWPFDRIVMYENACMFIAALGAVAATAASTRLLLFADESWLSGYTRGPVSIAYAVVVIAFGVIETATTCAERRTGVPFAMPTAPYVLSCLALVGVATAGFFFDALGAGCDAYSVASAAALGTAYFPAARIGAFKFRLIVAAWFLGSVALLIASGAVANVPGEIAKAFAEIPPVAIWIVGMVWAFVIAYRRETEYHDDNADFVTRELGIAVSRDELYPPEQE
jgi:hypothetical protein